MAETTLHTVTDHGVADRLADDEPNAGDIRGPVHRQVDDQRPRTGPTPVPDDGPEAAPAGQPVGRRQHGGGGRPTLRRPGSCGPCGGARTRWRGRRGYACAGGTRAPCDGDGCSAGTYACSRRSLSWCSVVLTVDSSPVGGPRPLRPDPARNDTGTGLSAGTAHPRKRTLPWTCGTSRRVHPTSRIRARVTTRRPANGTRARSTGSNPRSAPPDRSGTTAVPDRRDDRPRPCGESLAASDDRLLRSPLPGFPAGAGSTGSVTSCGRAHILSYLGSDLLKR